jgi:predicted porin
MKKAYMAFAFAVAGTASAQSSVTISGVLGVGVSSISGSKSGASDYKAGNELKMAQDSKVPTRFVIRGTEDFGDGMSAIFLLDKGFNIDDGTETLGGAFREDYVGLRSTKWGTVTLGRQFHPLFNVRDDFDPTADSSNLMATGGFRMNNSVMYRTPTINGWFAKVAYGFGEVQGDTRAGSAVGGHLGYDSSTISGKVGFNDLKDLNGEGSARNTLAAGSYNFGPVIGYLAYGVNKGAVTNGVYAPADNTDTLFGMRLPLGRNIISVSYILKNDKTAKDADANQLQVLYTYSLSKRTLLYSVFTHINNSNGAVYTTAHASAAPTQDQYDLGARPGDQEFSVGIRHNF